MGVLPWSMTALYTSRQGDNQHCPQCRKISQGFALSTVLKVLANASSCQRRSEIAL
jgi:hypothetical protein